MHDPRIGGSCQPFTSASTFDIQPFPQSFAKEVESTACITACNFKMVNQTEPDRTLNTSFVDYAVSQCLKKKGPFMHLPISSNCAWSTEDLGFDVDIFMLDSNACLLAFVGLVDCQSPSTGLQI